ncbi:MAG: exodeoxyribonuclease III [Deltaproteobacteria bacterium]|nr:exodeoxyribonuclease III [Deltaproteobacteria bacterium]MCW5801883.1 exodeoxyribonuclease III [Deltaproteobacteria bacterium]
MKLATWNVNSIRARNTRLFAWLEKEAPDVLCLQETKVEDEGFPAAAFEKAGYAVATFGQRSYNGVAIASRLPLADVARGFGDDPNDTDARVIAATVGGIRVVCLYVPNGQELTSDKYPYKLAWFGRLRAYLDRTVKPTDPVVVLGDMNVTPDDRDVWAPEKWKDQIHCSPPERAALAGVVQFGLVDLFRHHHGDAKLYSWWDYRGVSFFKDQGLRIDLMYGTQPVVARCTSCVIDRSARKGQDASDHAPVIAQIADLAG